jgi:hypothetical protein
MASEVGAAFVSLLPSMKNFSKLVKAQLKRVLATVRGEVSVTPKVDAATGSLRADLQQQLRAVTRQLTLEIPVEADNTRRLRSEVTAQLQAIRRTTRLEIPMEPTGVAAYRAELAAILQAVRARQLVQVHIDTDRTFRDAESRGGTAAQRTGRLFGGLFSQGFRLSLTNPIIGIPLAIAAVLSLPFLGAAITAAALSGGALAAVFIGAFLLRADPELKAGLEKLGGEISKGLTEAAKPFKGPLLESLGIIRKALKDIGPDVKKFFSTIAKSGGIQELARGIGGFLRQLADTGALDKFATGIGAALKQLGMAMPDIGNALAQLLITLSKPETIESVGDLFRGIADVIRIVGDILGWLTEKWIWFKGAIKSASETFAKVKEELSFIGGIISGSKEAWRQLRAAVTEAVFWIIVGAKQLWHWLTVDLPNAFTGMVNNVKELPGKIVSGLGDLKNLLVDAGKNVVGGLIDGIKSKFGALGNVADNIAQTIRDRLPFSPAKTGPLSGSGNPYHSGQVIAGDLAAGVQSKLPGVVTAADRLASQFRFGSRPGTTAQSGVSSLRIDTAGSRTDMVLVQMLRDSIDANFGGNVELALSSRRGR